MTQNNLSAVTISMSVSSPLYLANYSNEMVTHLKLLIIVMVDGVSTYKPILLKCKHHTSIPVCC